MRNFILSAAILVLGGCASSPYGNHLQAGVDQHRIASEAVSQLSEIWPPAKTQLDLRQETTDPFGQILINGLRDSGYAIQEFNPKTVNSPATSSALPFGYILDNAGESYYRLTLMVGAQSITRAYQERAGELVPVSYWAHKE